MARQLFNKASAVLLSVLAIILAGCVVLLPQEANFKPQPALIHGHGYSQGEITSPALIEAQITAPPAEVKQSISAEPAGKVTVIPAKPGATEDSLWERVIDGFELGEKSEPAVDRALAELVKHRRSTYRILVRARPYLWEITEAVEARGLPTELAILPAIESRFNPRANSHRRAQGLWQLIPSTAQHLGLEQNWWVDARLDVTQSTHAALDYLEYLYRRFDDWILALAAYNCGEARMQRALNKAGGNEDFWQLDLPAETDAYIPRLLALAVLLEDHEDYDLKLPDLPNQQTTDTILFERQIDLALAAQHADIDLSTLQSLNPSLLRWATPPGGPHRLRVPAGKSKNIQSTMAKVPASQWTQWQPYLVRDGDSLGLIAQRYGIQLADLKQINKLNSSLIRAGQTLVLPTSAHLALTEKDPAQQGISPPQGSVRVEYRIKSGDTLWDIAKMFKVSVATLSRWNGLQRGSILQPGKILIVWVDPDIPNAQLANAST